MMIFCLFIAQYAAAEFEREALEIHALNRHSRFPRSRAADLCAQCGEQDEALEIDTLKKHPRFARSRVTDFCAQCGQQDAIYDAFPCGHSFCYFCTSDGDRPCLVCDTEVIDYYSKVDASPCRRIIRQQPQTSLMSWLWSRLNKVICCTRKRRKL